VWAHKRFDLSSVFSFFKVGFVAVVQRNSVNPETMYSKEALIRVDNVKHTRNDLKSSTRVSAT
jgi:hypothetical protein